MTTNTLIAKVLEDITELKARLENPEPTGPAALSAAERIMCQFVTEFDVDGDIKAGREACKRQIAAVIEDEYRQNNNGLKELTTALFGAIQTIIAHPHGQVCKHWSALQILNAFEKTGIDYPKDLLDAIFENSIGDERAIEICKKLTNQD